MGTFLTVFRSVDSDEGAERPNADSGGSNDGDIIGSKWHQR